LTAVVLLLGRLQSTLLAQAKPPTVSDSDCVVCHGQKDLKSASGRRISVDAARHQASAHSVLSGTDCHTNIKHFPHATQIQRVSRTTCDADEAVYLAKSGDPLFFRRSTRRWRSCSGTCIQSYLIRTSIPRIESDGRAPKQDRINSWGIVEIASLPWSYAFWSVSFAPVVMARDRLGIPSRQVGPHADFIRLRLPIRPTRSPLYLHRPRRKPRYPGPIRAHVRSRSSQC
jgi:hypothetical protein